MHVTLRLVVHRNCIMVRLKVMMRLLGLLLQVWQDVQAHHDVLQQLLYLLIRLLYGARRLGQRVVVLVWGEAVAREKLGVRGGVGVRRWFGGVGGSRVKNRGLCFITWARLRPFVVGANL